MNEPLELLLHLAAEGLKFEYSDNLVRDNYLKLCTIKYDNKGKIIYIHYIMPGSEGKLKFKLYEVGKEKPKIHFGRDDVGKCKVGIMDYGN